MIKLILLTFFSLFSVISFGQTTENFSIDNGGELLNNNQLQVIYTIGEVSVNEFSNETLLVSEGFINSSSINSSLNNNSYHLTDLKIYPNPAVDLLFVNFLTTKNRKYQIFNTIGQKVVEIYLQGKTHSLNLQKLKKGIYFLIIQDLENNQFQKLKFIKK